MAFATKASLSSSSPFLLPGRRASAAAQGMVVARRPRAAAVALEPAPVPDARALEPAPVPDARALEPVFVPVVRKRKLSVSQVMSRLKRKNKTAFIPYITAGDPDLATTAEALRLLDSCGADVIELGMPFSDPYVDGTVIQASAARALASGTTLDGVMAMLKEVTPELSCPVVLYSYFNPIARRGAAAFASAAKEAGVQGLIIPDLPYEEDCAFRNEAIKNNLELVLLTTPTTSAERMEKIANASGGFVYLVSVTGITGSRATVNPHVEHLLQEIRKVSDKPVAVGFGISTPDHVRQIAEWGADGVIIGSAMVKQLGEAVSPRQGLKRLEIFARSLKSALS